MVIDWILLLFSNEQNDIMLQLVNFSIHKTVITIVCNKKENSHSPLTQTNKLRDKFDISVLL